MAEQLTQSAQDILKEENLQKQYDMLNKSLLSMRDLIAVAEKLEVKLTKFNRHGARSELLDALMCMIVEADSGKPPQNITIYEYVKEHCNLNRLYHLFKEFYDANENGTLISERPYTEAVMLELNGLREAGRYHLLTRDAWGKAYPHDLEVVVYMLLAEKSVAAIDRIKQRR